MPDEPRQHRGLSWGMMLVLLFAAILIAAGISFWMIYPFFHQHAR